MSTFVLEIQLYLIFFNMAPIRANFARFGLCRNFGGLGLASKVFFRPTNVDYQLWFWQYSHIFCYSLVCTFALFWPFGAIFCLWGSFCVFGGGMGG